MEEKYDGGPAFPRQEVIHPALGSVERGYKGMSLRDYFASQTLIGIVSLQKHTPDHAAQYAYEIADAMLNERDS